MTVDPFAKADPAVISVGHGDLGLCPCGWCSEVFHRSHARAQAALDGHMRSVHPERWRFRPHLPAGS